MMTDIVEKLRLGVSLGQCGEMSGICLNAANEIERLRETLRKIAAYDDHSAQKHLEKTGSYGAFDEPGSVGIAREALEWVCPIGNKDCKENCGNYGCGN